MYHTLCLCIALHVQTVCTSLHLLLSSYSRKSLKYLDWMIYLNFSHQTINYPFNILVRFFYLH